MKVNSEVERLRQRASLAGRGRSSQCRRKFHKEILNLSPSDFEKKERNEYSPEGKEYKEDPERDRYVSP